MKSPENKKAHIDDPDNIEFVERIDKLMDLFGLTQREIAELLEISPGQLSRVKSGERHAARKHIRVLRNRELELKKERGIRPKRTVSSILSIDHSVLERLSPHLAVEAFRDLLWARAAHCAIPVTNISISNEVFVPDGGVDASILDREGTTIPEDELLTSGTRYQIKTGDFKPWQPSEIKKELFGGKDERFENLGTAVQEALQDGKRFVFVCFGTDPIDKDLRKARKNLKNAFTKCGFPDANVKVWGQTQLIGLFNQYPSLCLRLLGHDQHEFRSLKSWARDEDMQPVVHYSPEQHQFIEDCQNDLLSGEMRHLRLIGEPGVGKTRLALEISKTASMAPATLYVRDGRSFLRSSFINELLQPDDHRFVILVIDECPRKERAELWNIVKPRSDRIRLLTIDHGPDDASDELMQLHEVEPAGTEQIVSILKDHDIGELDAKRWAEFCEGCPRVAHVIGENLHGCEDLLKSPSTVDVWDRFIVGKYFEDVEVRKRVLYFISLFEKFGFEHPVEDESIFIAELAGVPWPQFQQIVNRLKERRILQGAKTLYLTPRLLHIHLFHEFWEVHGSSFDIIQTLQNMPASLQRWFIHMLRYAHESNPAESAIDRLLGRGGLFPEDSFPDNHRSGTLVLALAEACPLTTLRCLRRTIGSMGVEELHRVTESRQSVVWALEKLAVWEDRFIDASNLLLDLAEAENAKNSNNATGTYCQLFSLIPGMAGTAAPYALRRQVLEQTLEQPSRQKRWIGLQACKTALEITGGFRMIGPEYQGLRRTIKFWMPETYGEMWDAYHEIWQLLVVKLELWDGEDRARLISTLISAAWSMMSVKALTSMVIETLTSIAHDPATDVKSLIQLIQRKLRHDSKDLSPKQKKKLQSIIDDLDGHDFHSRLTRFIQYLTWEDTYDEDTHSAGRAEKKLDELADEAIRNTDLLMAEIPWLVCENSGPAFGFGLRLGKRDPDRTLLPKILKYQCMKPDESATSFLSGYLATIYNENPEEWESTVIQLADNPATANRFSEFVIDSGISDRIAQRVIHQCRIGAQSKEKLKRWWFASQIRLLSPGVFEELVELQLEECSEKMWSNAIHMCHTYFLEKDNERQLPEDLIFNVLTHKAIGSDGAAYDAGYQWSRLAQRFLEQYPKRKWDFFQTILTRTSQDWSVLLDLSTQKEQILTTILQEEPEKAFSCIAEVFLKDDGQRQFGLQTWLRDGGHRGFSDDAPGPIQHIPIQTLFDWIDQDIEKHGYWLAGALPKTFDKTPRGRLTRDFIARYGDNSEVASALRVSFGSRSFCGNASDYYRSLRESARGWLVGESEPPVVRWVDDYIYGLTYHIERSELDEERWG